MAVVVPSWEGLEPDRPDKSVKYVSQIDTEFEGGSCCCARDEQAGIETGVHTYFDRSEASTENVFLDSRNAAKERDRAF